MDESIYTRLSKDLSEDAIQKTDKRETRKGYDTTGYGYQWCVDRFNDVLGEKWGFDFEIIKEISGTYKKGTPYFEITTKVSMWINDKENKRACVGGHTAINYADALKGAITNGFKKTAAFWGVGAKAFRGEIDDDHSLPEDENNKQANKTKPHEDPQRKLLLAQMKDVIKSGFFEDAEIITARAEVERAKTNQDLNAILVKYQSELNIRKSKQDKLLKGAEKAFDGKEVKDDFVDDIPGEQPEIF